MHRRHRATSIRLHEDCLVPLRCRSIPSLPTLADQATRDRRSLASCMLEARKPTERYGACHPEKSCTMADGVKQIRNPAIHRNVRLHCTYGYETYRKKKSCSIVFALPHWLCTITNSQLALSTLHSVLTTQKPEERIAYGPGEKSCSIVFAFAIVGHSVMYTAFTNTTIRILRSSKPPAND
jgi:hypothetical protein